MNEVKIPALLVTNSTGTGETLYLTIPPADLRTGLRTGIVGETSVLYGIFSPTGNLHYIDIIPSHGPFLAGSGFVFICIDADSVDLTPKALLKMCYDAIKTGNKSLLHSVN